MPKVLRARPATNSDDEAKARRLSRCGHSGSTNPGRSTVTCSQAEAVREQLRRVFAPYISLCAGPALSRGQRLVVDWDFTAKQITTEAKPEPFAAYGHMEDGLGKGYQWAEVVLRGSGPDGQDRAVSLSRGAPADDGKLRVGDAGGRGRRRSGLSPEDSAFLAWSTATPCT